MNDRTGRLETWAVVFGDNAERTAGFVREIPMGTGTALRIDVPEVTYTPYHYGNRDKPADVTIPAFVTFRNWAFVREVTPCSEESARKVATEIRVAPPGRDVPEELPF